MSTLLKTQTAENSLVMTNPLVKRIGKIKETSENHATYKGIAVKCLFFMLMVVAGVVIEIVMHTAFPLLPYDSPDAPALTVPEIIGAMIAFVLFIAGSIIASFISVTAPVAGAVSCISIGFVITFLANAMENYRGAVLLALIITFALVATMQILFFTGKIKVTKKFRSVITVFFVTTVLSSVLVFICSFIPGLSDIVTYIFGNPLVSVGLSLIGIVIATLFLLTDFDTIQKTVENKLPKKYEWVSAFSLTFTIIWLYLEVLNLISMVNDNNK